MGSAAPPGARASAVASAPGHCKLERYNQYALAPARQSVNATYLYDLQRCPDRAHDSAYHLKEPSRRSVPFTQSNVSTLLAPDPLSAFVGRVSGKPVSSCTAHAASTWHVKAAGVCS